jgi:hypothetical protein
LASHDTEVLSYGKTPAYPSPVESHSLNHFIYRGGWPIPKIITDFMNNGDYTRKLFYATMVGAVISGRRAARIILNPPGG